MSNFNWEDHPEANVESTDSSFNWDALPEVEEPKRTLAGEVEKENLTKAENKPEVSALRSALVGAGEGSTFGFAEELTAPVVAAAGMVSGLPSESPEESTWEKYQRLMQTYRDVARDEQKAAQEQHPGAYTAGAVAGGIAAPGLGVGKLAAATKGLGRLAKVGVGSAAGATMGGLAGLGSAEGSLQERLPEAKEGMKTGAIVGAALPITSEAVKGAGKLAGEVGELPMIKRGIEAFKRGTKGENLYTERGLKEAEENVYKQSEKLYNKIQDVREKIGKDIELKIKQADESGQKVDLKEVMDNAYKQLDEIEKGNPGQETLSYLKSLRAELNQLLGKKVEADEFMGVPKENLPEGLITPSKPKPSYEVLPSKAREIKQNMYGYTPSNVKTQTGTVNPLVAKPAQVAQDVYTGVDQELEKAVGNLDNNQKYSVIKDTLKRLISKEKQFQEMDVEKINDMLKKIEDPAAGKSSRLFEWTMNQLDDVDPNVRKEFQDQIKDSVDRYKLSKDIQSGGIFSGILGTQRSLGGTASNIAGIVAGKTGLATAGKAIGKTTSTVTDTLLNNPVANKGIIQGTVNEPTMIRKATEPYKLQRQVANAAENAEPDLLKEQAQAIREQHGKQGEQLATILENMADKDKNARRALMFTILQNHAYRKMLGLQDEEAQ